MRIDCEGNVEKLMILLFDVLKYMLEENGWIVICFLGIELKIKFYIGVKGNFLEDVVEKVVVYEVII